MTTPTDDLATVLDAVGTVIAAVRPDQWDNPTPCPKWTVRDVANHLVLGDRLFTAILRGEATVDPAAFDPHRGDILGDDPAAAARAEADALLAAFRAPGVLERIVTVPAGTVPGFAAVHLRIVEHLLHGWDIATATGRQLVVPDAVVAPEVAFTEAKLADLPPGRSPFAAPVPVAGDAPPLVRLAALTGRAAT